MAKYITIVLILTSRSILDKLSYDLTRSSCNSIYVGCLLNNVEQHANSDHNNDVDNHVNLATAYFGFEICCDFCDE
jgi:hypothetical protein